MKTIKYHRKHGGYVDRVSNQEADKIVKENKANYAPKHWYKAAKRIENIFGDDPYNV